MHLLLQLSSTHLPQWWICSISVVSRRTHLLIYIYTYYIYRHSTYSKNVLVWISPNVLELPSHPRFFPGSSSSCRPSSSTTQLMRLHRMTSPSRDGTDDSSRSLGTAGCMAMSMMMNSNTGRLQQKHRHFAKVAHTTWATKYNNKRIWDG